MPIRVLDAVTVSKIAAGEVVERPASVLKELVENALDAGARHITVEIRAGGIDYLRVTDDGCGIAPEQVRMAFENHATSKLREVRDLVEVSTMGFRGEALPSIAAVSRVEMTTRARGADAGMRISLEGGEVKEVEPAGCPDGTTLCVRDLFFNLPARRAFLKRPAAEAGACIDALSRLALGHPDVAFRMTNGGKLVLRTQGDGVLRHVIMAVYDRNTAQNMREVSGSIGALTISGLIGVGSCAKASRAHQHFFVNGRAIRCPMLSQTLEQACRGRVLIGRFPMCALSLEMPLSSVDVNVHPGKLEVRFRDESGLYTAASVLLERVFDDENMLTPEHPPEEAHRPTISIERSEAPDDTGAQPGSAGEAQDALGIGVVRISRSGDVRREDSAGRAGANAACADAAQSDAIRADAAEADAPAKSESGAGNARTGASETSASGTAYANAEQSTPHTAEESGASAVDISCNADAKARRTQPEPLDTGHTSGQSAPKAVDKARGEAGTPACDMHADARNAAQGEDICAASGADSGDSAEDMCISLGLRGYGVGAASVDKADARANAPVDSGSGADVRGALGRTGLAGGRDAGGRVRMRESSMLMTAERPTDAQDAAQEVPLTLMQAAGLEDADSQPEQEWHVVGTAFSTYIFVQQGDTLYAIDQHAAHERILYERFMRQWESGTASQMLLVPYTVSVSAAEKAQIMENRELLEEIGFDIDDFGERDIQVRAVPQIMGEPDLRPFFLMSAAELKRLRSAPLAARRDAVMQAACKHAVKGGDALGNAEIEALLTQMRKTGAPPNCPHGRPVIIAIPRTELEKRFSRIV